MTKKLAKERFGGDQVRAIHYIIENYDGEQLVEYMRDFNGKQSSIFLDIVTSKMEYEESCKEDYEEASGDQSSKYGVLYFKDEQNRNAPNPYSAKIKIGILILIGIIAASVAAAKLLAGYVDDFVKDLIITLVEVLSSISSLNLAVNILSYFDYQNKKKYMEMILSSYEAKKE